MLHGLAMSSEAGAKGRTAARLLPLATLLVLTCFLAGTSADADLWGHLTFGRDIVRTHAVGATDPYSFTSDRPWVNHEWLAEAIMWIFYAAGGGAGLIVLKLSLAWAANTGPVFPRPLREGQAEDYVSAAMTERGGHQPQRLRPFFNSRVAQPPPRRAADVAVVGERGAFGN